jgi:hypothetical protein
MEVEFKLQHSNPELINILLSYKPRYYASGIPNKIEYTFLVSYLRLEWLAWIRLRVTFYSHLMTEKWSDLTMRACLFISFLNWILLVLYSRNWHTLVSTSIFRAEKIWRRKLNIPERWYSSTKIHGVTVISPSLHRSWGAGKAQRLLYIPVLTLRKSAVYPNNMLLCFVWFSQGLA